MSTGLTGNLNQIDHFERYTQFIEMFSLQSDGCGGAANILDVPDVRDVTLRQHVRSASNRHRGRHLREILLARCRYSSVYHLLCVSHVTSFSEINGLT